MADAGDAIADAYFEKQNFTLSRKADHSEVTQADRETETAIVDFITRLRPSPRSMAKNMDTVAMLTHRGNGSLTPSMEPLILYAVFPYGRR